jgi:hypothetical protein
MATMLTVNVSKALAATIDEGDGPGDLNSNPKAPTSN